MTTLAKPSPWWFHSLRVVLQTLSAALLPRPWADTSNKPSSSKTKVVQAVALVWRKLQSPKQIKPIARFTADPTVLVVRADSPWKTYPEFVAYVKANPAKISFGSSGNYGTMHVPMEQLKAATSTFMLHVPYTGAAPAVMGLLAGQIEALSTGPASVVQQIKAGKLRALAHWGDGRLSSLPDVPSLKELGVPIAYAQWSGLFVPANTPAPVVEKLRQAAKFAAQDARANQAMAAAGTSFMFQDSPEFERYVTGDAKEMAKLVQRIGKVD